MTQFNTWDCELLTKSVEAVRTVCRRVCGNPDIKIIGVTNDQYNYSYGLQMGTDKSYPYITVMPAEVDDEDVSYNKHVLNNSGFTVNNGGPDENTKIEKRGETVYKFQLVPVKVVLNVSYFTQNTKDVWQFIQRWKYNYRRATFSLTAGNNFSVDIRTELSSNIQFPEKNLESGDCYKISGTITLHTYAGQIFEQKTVDKINLNVILTPNQLKDFESRNNNFVLIKQFELKDK